MSILQQIKQENKGMIPFNYKKNTINKITLSRYTFREGISRICLMQCFGKLKLMIGH